MTATLQMLLRGILYALGFIVVTVILMNYGHLICIAFCP